MGDKIKRKRNKHIERREKCKRDKERKKQREEERGYKAGE